MDNDEIARGTLRIRFCKLNQLIKVFNKGDEKKYEDNAK